MLLAVWVVSAGQLGPQEKRGKRIYLKGTASSGREITATLAEDSVEVPASTLACVGCHGFDGQGNQEGGAIPSNITWGELTKPYGVANSEGRVHPPYTERSMALAVSAGLDPAGNKLSSPMPRYRLSREDMADLTAYLKQLGKDPDPGLGDTTITVGTVLPSQGQFAAVGQSVRTMLEACVAEINSQGGVYNRKLELRVADGGDGSANTLGNIEQFFQGEKIFATLGAFVAGIDKETAAIAEREQTPLIGPLTLFPQTGYPLNRYVFYLQPGARDQARALVTFAKTKLDLASPKAAILYSGDPASEEAAEGAEQQAKNMGWSAVVRVKFDPRTAPSKVVADLIQNGTNLLVLLNPEPDVISLLEEAEKRQWPPRVLIPGAAASRRMLEVAAGFKGRIFFSFPIIPGQGSTGTIDFRSLAAKYNLPAQPGPSQIAAYCAFRVLIEGLQRAGRDLSREKLVATLEGLYDFDTGLMPPLSYGPNRRIGAMGAYVVTMDPEKKRLTPAGGWIPVN